MKSTALCEASFRPFAKACAVRSGGTADRIMTGTVVFFISGSLGVPEAGRPAVNDLLGRRGIVNGRTRRSGWPAYIISFVFTLLSFRSSLS